VFVCVRVHARARACVCVAVCVGRWVGGCVSVYLSLFECVSLSE
jgi:hypothetical protein